MSINDEDIPATWFSTTRKVSLSSTTASSVQRNRHCLRLSGAPAETHIVRLRRVVHASGGADPNRLILHREVVVGRLVQAQGKRQ